MKITTEINPYDFLKNDSWECGDLADVIADHDCVAMFNDLVEEYFDGQNPSKTELNDFLRFNQSEIIYNLGIVRLNENEEE